MDKFINTALGGIAEVWDDERWYLGQSGNQGIYQAFNDLFRSYGDNVIIQGCVVDLTVPASTTITAGWVIFGSELLRVDAQTFDSTTIQFFTKETSNDSTGLKNLLSGGIAQTYQKNRAKITANSGNLKFDGARLGRIKTVSSTASITTFSSTGQTLMAHTPSTTLGATNMRISFGCTLNEAASGSSTVGITISIKIAGILKHKRLLTVDSNNGFHNYSVETVEPYIAGQEITITGIHNQASEVITMTDQRIICEGWDG